MLGLLAATDARWASAAVADLEAVLRDHAHCELKAATHAMSLVARHPDDLELVRKLVALARQELDHFERVVALLAERGLSLGPPPVDEYAAALRARASALPRLRVLRGDLVDRLLVAALIEARSCERFKLLANALGQAHPLHAFYTELFAAEAGHHRDYVEMAASASTPAVADSRLAELAELEAHIVRSGADQPRATIHG
jgi:tRNA-(ms[2]io[6]A)-hydroxylase